MLCGDANGDGRVSIVDALWTARHVTGLSAEPFSEPAADGNGDGRVSIVDALMIARFVTGLPASGGCLEAAQQATMAAVPLAGPLTGSITGAATTLTTEGGVRLLPESLLLVPGQQFTLEVHADTVGLRLGAYDLRLGFDPALVRVVEAAGTDHGVSAGADALGTWLVALDAATGELTLTGFDAQGKAPGSDLDLLRVQLEAVGAGSTEIGVEVRDLSTELGEPIPTGEPAGTGIQLTIAATQTFTIDLRQGMNLVPIRWASDTLSSRCSDLLDALGGAAVVERVGRLDPVAQRWQWCDGAGGDDFTIMSGEAYLVLATAAHQATIEAVASCPALALEAGVNLRGHPAPTAGLSCRGWLTELGSAAVVAIRRYDRATGRFETCAFGDVAGAPVAMGVDFVIDPAAGYLLHAPAAGLYPVPGCGQ